MGARLDEIRASDVGKRASTIMAEEGEPEARTRDVPDADASARDAVARILGFDVSTEELDSTEELESTEELDDDELVPFEREAPIVDIFDMVLEGYDSLPIIALGLMAFESAATRDVALLHYAFGREVGERMAADATRWATIQRETGRSMDDLVEADLNAGKVNTESGNMLLGRTDRVPDRARLGATIRMLRVLVAHAPDELRPAPLTMLAWCLWAVGSVAAAGAMLDRAARLAPSYRMAALLRTWLDAGAVPDWLFARLSS